MDTARGRRWRFAAVVALLVVASLFLVDPTARATQDSRPETRLVPVTENGTALLWPYTGRRQSFSSATLPINVVFYGNPAVVRYAMTEQTDAEWNASTVPETNATANDTRVAINATGLRWRRAEGATRYTYVWDASNASGHWIDETYQVRDGDYFGTRVHLRLYGWYGRQTWTAGQAHHEHWDWFRLRHTVDGLERAQHYIEADFYDEPYVSRLQRVRFGRVSTYDQDQWVTLVDIDDRAAIPPILDLAAALLPAAVLAGALTGRAATLRGVIRHWRANPPATPRHLALWAALAAIPVLVRVGSIAAEHSALGRTPKLIAVGFYPVLAVGLPVCAYLLADGLPADEAAAVAVVGLGAGVLADYAVLGVQAIPLHVLTHRLVLLAAIGVIAGSGADRSTDGTDHRRIAAIGAAVWCLALLWPLLDLG